MVEVGVVDTRLAVATLSGRGARVYTYTCVYDNIPCRSLPKYADRRIHTHLTTSPQQGCLPVPEGPAHTGRLGDVTGIGAAWTGGVLVDIDVVKPGC